jgi:type IV secretory pathway TrbF-like protein
MDAEEIDYQLTKAYWDDRTNSLVKQNRTLRNGLFATFGLLGLSVWGVIHLGGSVKTEVIPVFVDNTGATTAGDSGGQTLAPGQWNQMKYSAFSNYVTQWRTVTSDDKLRKRFWDSSFEWIQARSKAETDLKNWFKQHNPDTRSLEETVSVVVDSGSPITENTYEVWWTESTY